MGSVHEGRQLYHRLFTYLNREWVKSEKETGRKGIYPVYTVRPPASPHLFTIRTGIHVDHLILSSPHADGEVVFGAMENQLLHPDPK